MGLELASDAHVVRVNYVRSNPTALVICRDRFDASVEVDGRATKVHLSVGYGNPCRQLQVSRMMQIRGVDCGVAAG